MGLLDLFAAMGDPIKPTTEPSRKQPAGKSAKPKTPASPTPKPKATTYWQPLAVVLYTARWRCTCGAHGAAAPTFFLREQHGPAGGKFSQLRLRAIGDSLTAYPNLPLEVEEAEPSIVRHCAECTGSFFRPRQLPLPLGIPVPTPPVYQPTPVEQLFDEYEQMRIDANSTRALL